MFAWPTAHSRRLLSILCLYWAALGWDVLRPKYFHTTSQIFIFHYGSSVFGNGDPQPPYHPRTESRPTQTDFASAFPCTSFFRADVVICSLLFLQLLETFLRVSMVRSISHFSFVNSITQRVSNCPSAIEPFAASLRSLLQVLHSARLSNVCYFPLLPLKSSERSLASQKLWH